MTEITGDLSRKLDNLSVENSEKSEKCEEFEKWNELPVDLKSECIKKMNFAMRYQLRQTARVEKQLADSLRYKFDQLYLNDEWFSVCKNESREEYVIREEFFDISSLYKIGKIISQAGFTPVSMLSYVLKHCDFEEFYFQSCTLLDRINFDKLDTVLKPKHVILHGYLKSCNIDSSMPMLRKCWDKVETVSLYEMWKPVEFEELFAIPAVFNAKNVSIGSWNLTATNVILLIEKWTEINAKVGTKICSDIRTDLPNPLFDHFESRSVSREESTMRIRTDNPNKHILMHFSTREFPYFCVTVIPANIEESQYPEFTSQLEIEPKFSSISNRLF